MKFNLLLALGLAPAAVLAEKGPFFGYCGHNSLDYSTLISDCTNGQTSIDLNHGLANANGNLVWRYACPSLHPSLDVALRCLGTCRRLTHFACSATTGATLDPAPRTVALATSSSTFWAVTALTLPENRIGRASACVSDAQPPLQLWALTTTLAPHLYYDTDTNSLFFTGI